MTPRLIHRDAMVLVIDKPCGLPVHPGPQAQGRRIPTLTDYLDDLRFGLPRKPEAAHRLDKDTSGCLVLGRHAKAIALLNKLFAQGRIDKSYWAVVEGGPAQEAGVIDLPLGRKDPTRGWWMAVKEDGLPSLTRYTVLGRGQDSSGAAITLLELVPETGRTHQLRVHCAAIGCPIWGDAVYGHGDRHGPPSLHLHARSLTLALASSKPPLHIVADPPPHMLERLAACGWIADNSAPQPPLNASARA